MIDGRSEFKHILLPVMAMAVYICAFLLLYQLFGAGVAALVTAPVTLIGWHHGWRWGALAGVIGVLINIVLLVVATEVESRNIIGSSASGSLVVIAIGAGVGKLHDLLQQVRRQAQELTCEREKLTAHIQERERTQAALKREHDFTAAVLETVGGLVIVLDRDGRIVRFNRTCECITGYSFAEVQDRYVWDFLLLPAEAEGVKREFARLLIHGDRHASTDPQLYENHWITKDGERRRIAWSSTTLMDLNGQPEYVIGTGIDITEQRQMQEALRASEVKLRAIVDHTTDSIFIKDLDRRYVLLNPAAAQTFGKPHNEWLGCTDVELFGAEIDDEFRTTDLYVLENDIPYTFEHTRVVDDLERVWLTTKYPYKSPQGETIGVIGISREITERTQGEQAVRAAEARYRDLVEHASDIIYTHDLWGNITAVNTTTERLTGYICEELVGRNIIQFVAPEDLPRVRQELKRKAHGATPSTPYELDLIRKDGSRLPVEINTRLLMADGKAVGVEGIARDITERRRVQEALRQSEARKSAILEAALDAIITVDHAGRITEFNPAAEQMFGYRRTDAIGQPMAELIIPPRLRSLHQQSKAHYFATGRGKVINKRIETIGMRADGTEFPVEIAITRIPSSGPPMFTGFLRDITERKQTEAQLRQHAFYDGLTGLPNRALFMDRLTQALARAERHNTAVALLFLDLDNLKVINDSLGHHCGDQMLVVAAERLQACLRPEDTAARLGGDEFTVVLETIGDIDAVLKVAKRIQAQMRIPMQIDEHELVVTASIGIVVSGPSLSSPDELLGAADIAMYQAKTNGKGQSVVFEPWMSSKARERLALETDLRRAIAHDELRVHYQPIIDLTSGRVVAAEALVRWEHPQRGLVTPAAFIPLAEETGLIIPLGNWVLEQVCRQLRAWHLDHPHAGSLRVAVNLSARQFQNPMLAKDIARLLETTEVDPACLELELTESVVMQDAATTIDTLHQLKALGVQLALDDFGTGYSSLAYLKRFPIDVLKIDRSFVQRLGCDTQDAEIIRAIITLAHTLNVAVIGEGIETEEQIDHLRALGCDHGQGYLFAKPMSGEELDAFLTDAAEQADAPESFFSPISLICSDEDVLHRAP